MVAQGKFRQDLYYRINVMRIDAPRCRTIAKTSRRSPTHFLRQYSDLYQKPMDVHRARRHGLRWRATPGPATCANLENVIQRAIILAQVPASGGRPAPAHSGTKISSASTTISLPAPSSANSATTRSSWPVAAVREHNGNKTLAARSLQISRAYLHRLIRGAGSELASIPEIPSWKSSREHCSPGLRRNRILTQLPAASYKGSSPSPRQSPPFWPRLASSPRATASMIPTCGGT